jgi:hypothetical protein
VVNTYDKEWTRMTSEQLADEVQRAIMACRDRVLGVGADQYDDGSGTQKFETLPAAELAAWLLEEADDLIVYAVMLRIRSAKFAAAAALLE